MAMTIVGIVTFVTLFKKLDLNMSAKLTFYLILPFLKMLSIYSAYAIFGKCLRPAVF